jgi:inosose dehydratase
VIQADELLAQIKRIGFEALETGPVGYFGANLKQSGIPVVGTWLFVPFHDPTKKSATEAQAIATCKDIVATGGRKVLMVDELSAARAATAGRTEAATRLSGQEWIEFIATINQIGDICRSYDLEPIFHPHAGTYVEFSDEIDRLMDCTAFDLCIDTAHSVYAGIDPSQLIEQYNARVTHVHLKDVDAKILQHSRANAVDFWTAMSNGIFCPIGEGVIDYRAFLTALKRVGYRAFVTIEQDPIPGHSTQVANLLEASMQKSWDYIAGIRRSVA